MGCATERTRGRVILTPSFRFGFNAINADRQNGRRDRWARRNFERHESFAAVPAVPPYLKQGSGADYRDRECLRAILPARRRQPVLPFPSASREFFAPPCQQRRVGTRRRVEFA